MKELIKNNKIKIDKDSFKNSKEYFIIYITSDVTVRDYDINIQEEINEEIEKLLSEYSNLEVNQIPNIAYYRSLLKSYSRDPNRYRHSSEALLKRVIKEKNIYQINNVVDFNNLLSLKYLIPVGSYDLNKIIGSINLKIAGVNDEINCLKSSNFKINGIPSLFDDIGAFGNIISDSKRTLIQGSTEKILTVLFFLKKPNNISSIKKELLELCKVLLLSKSIKIYSNEENL